jgi:transposase InsO family protein
MAEADSPMSCFTDWKYVQAGKTARARNLLKYLQYREDAINHVPRAGGPERWVDCGLGGNWQEILRATQQLESRKVLLRSLVVRPPQELVAQLQEVDPERWTQRRELVEELVHRVMDAEMQRAGFQRPNGSMQALDLPYSYVLHAHDDERGIESPHAHVIIPAMDAYRERPFNVYPGDHLHTRRVAEEECERLFELDRVRGRLPEFDREQEREQPEPTEEQEPEPDLPPDLQREIEFFPFHEGGAQ